MASLRRWFWKHVLRYHYEICWSCGKPVGHRYPFGREPLTWWHVSDTLWVLVEGDSGGLRCPQCFTRDCEKAGIPIHWKVVLGK